MFPVRRTDLHTDNAIQGEHADPLPPTSQNTSEAQGSAAAVEDEEQKETRGSDQSAERGGAEPRQEALPDGSQADCEDEIFKDSTEPEEPVETFFSTMSHRYDPMSM